MAFNTNLESVSNCCSTSVLMRDDENGHGICQGCGEHCSSVYTEPIEFDTDRAKEMIDQLAAYAIEIEKAIEHTAGLEEQSYIGNQYGRTPDYSALYAADLNQLRRIKNKINSASDSIETFIILKSKNNA